MSALTECKSGSSDLSIRETAIAFLKEHRGEGFFSFLDTFAKGVRRDRQESNVAYHFTILDGDLLATSTFVKTHLFKKCLEEAYASKSVTTLGKRNNLLDVRLFNVTDSIQVESDLASILYYQKDRIDPSTFKPLNLFSQQDQKQRFIAAEVQVLMGDRMMPLAEYLCPYSHESTVEDSVSALVADPSTVQVTRMVKKHIGPCLNHIGKIFERIVKPSTRYTADSLKRDLAELVYKWTFTSPYEKEDDGVAELLQETLAALHGFQITSHAKIYQKVLENPYFPGFLKKYNEVVQLKYTQVT